MGNYYHGFGVLIEANENKKITMDRLLALLELTDPDTKADYLYDMQCDIADNWPDQEVPMDELIEMLVDGDECCCTFAPIVANAIQHNEGIRLYVTSIGGEDVLVFEKSYPWYMNEKEKELTPEKLIAILAKYLKIITDTVFTIGMQDWWED